MEAPLAYHYLKRPYTLVPMMLEALPEARYYDREGRVLQGMRKRVSSLLLMT